MAEESHPDPSTIHQLLADAAHGDREAVDQLFQEAYDELRSLARSVRRGDGGHSVNTTALVHEAYFKLSPKGLKADNLLHFRRIVGRAMRQVLVDAARGRAAAKRGGGDAIRMTLDDQVGGSDRDAIEFVQLEEALSELERVDPRCAQVVECRFFSGMDVEETARALGISTPTVKRDWRVARAWLARAMSS